MTYEGTMPIEDDRVVSPISEESRRARQLLKEVGQLEGQDKLEIIQEIGRQVHESDLEKFKMVLKENLTTGTIEVAGWKRHSVRVLLEVCAEGKLNVRIKNGDRFLSAVMWPKTEVMIEVFVDSILTGECA